MGATNAETMTKLRLALLVLPFLSAGIAGAENLRGSAEGPTKAKG